MPIDPERWTNNTKAAFSAATGHAASSNHPELTAAHLLDALLQQQETMTRPLLSQVGVDPDALAGKMHDQLLRLPQASGDEHRMTPIRDDACEMNHVTDAPHRRQTTHRRGKTERTERTE